MPCLKTSARLVTSTLCCLLLTGCLPGGDAPESIATVANQGVYSATFSQDGQWLMVGSIHNGGSLWSLWPPERHFDWNHREGSNTGVLASAFSADQQFVASADNRTIVLWQRQTGEAVSFWNTPGDIEDLALSSDGRYALLAMRDYTATLFDIQNGGIRQRLQHDGAVFDVDLDGSDQLAASASDDLTARIWQLETGKELLRLAHGNQVRTVSLSRDGRWLFSSALRETGKLWEVSSGQLQIELPKPVGYYACARFSTDGSQLLTGSSDGLVSLWHTTDGTLLRQWRITGNSVWNQPRVLVEDVAFGSSHYLAVGTNGQVYQLQ
ncbi:WD40 repeat domain-containing protein [Oceanobacter antarcticus]|uniref:WD-40 repeat-containing protein n=1 Tax=Oceanobacter antarcticus TaxID=3133425 RepID=A0ABW8NHQ1_9GAMM